MSYRDELSLYRTIGAPSIIQIILLLLPFIQGGTFVREGSNVLEPGSNPLIVLSILFKNTLSLGPIWRFHLHIVGFIWGHDQNVWHLGLWNAFIMEIKKWSFSLVNRWVELYMWLNNQIEKQLVFISITQDFFSVHCCASGRLISLDTSLEHITFSLIWKRMFHLPIHLPGRHFRTGISFQMHDSSSQLTYSRIFKT